MKTWLKGGLIGAAIPIGIKTLNLIFFMLIVGVSSDKLFTYLDNLNALIYKFLNPGYSFCCNSFECYPSGFSLFGGSPGITCHLALNWILIPILFFIIGAIMGLIIQKIKSKKQETK